MPDTDLLGQIISSPDRSPITVKYSGVALRSGVMDLSDFIPALTSLRRAVLLASSALSGDGADPHVLISAETRVSSYEFTLVVVMVASALHPLITLENVKTALEIGKTLFGEGGLIDTIKKTKGKPTTEVHQEALKDGSVALTVIGDNNTVIVAKDVAKLLKRPDIVESVWQSIAPVTRRGISGVTFSPPNEVVEVTAEDASSFRPPKALEIEEDSFKTVDVVLDIIKPCFDEGKRWRFEFDGLKFGAKMEDRGFQQAVQRREILFGTGDRLHVKLIVSKHRNGETDYFVRRVIEVIRPPEQLRLDDRA